MKFVWQTIGKEEGLTELWDLLYYRSTRMRCVLITAMKRSLRFALWNRKNLCRIADDTTLHLPPAIDHTQQLQPNPEPDVESGCISISSIFAKSTLLACFSGHRHHLSQVEPGEEVRDDNNGFRSVWLAGFDPATSTADRNYLMVHTSMRYAIFI